MSKCAVYTNSRWKASQRSWTATSVRLELDLWHKRPVAYDGVGCCPMFPKLGHMFVAQAVFCLVNRQAWRASPGGGAGTESSKAARGQHCQSLWVKHGVECAGAQWRIRDNRCSAGAGGPGRHRVASREGRRRGIP